MFKKKETSKFLFRITFASCSGLPDGSLVALEWKRGDKAANHGETQKVPVDSGVARWPGAVAEMHCTLFSDGLRGFEPKKIALTVQEFKKDKAKVLGTTKVDLAEYAGLNGASRAAVVPIPCKKTKGATFSLNATFFSESSNACGPASLDPGTKTS
eukprot:m51a1_g12252 hypothetical protein (156) ;mRNA; f:157287-157930